jgi:hypothetical protein
MLPEAVNVMMLVVGVFKRLQIPYFIGGSMASVLHGVARSTLDAYMVAEIHLTQAGALVKALGDDFYVDEEMIRDAIHHHGSFNLIHLATMFKVDVFIRKERHLTGFNFSAGLSSCLQPTPNKKPL